MLPLTILPSCKLPLGLVPMLSKRLGCSAIISCFTSSSISSISSMSSSPLSLANCSLLSLFLRLLISSRKSASLFLSCFSCISTSCVSSCRGFLKSAASSTSGKSKGVLQLLHTTLYRFWGSSTLIFLQWMHLNLFKVLLFLLPILTVKQGLVSPSMGSPFLVHWNFGGGQPSALDLSTISPPILPTGGPGDTMRLLGCSVTKAVISFAL
mmetsp:Transcript_17384/g.35888  ORF Transcript_17384/g.35888 Transcript_17384/m.35888 type:complete len:210 (+) Transcript_17384:4877-5506(+)